MVVQKGTTLIMYNTFGTHAWCHAAMLPYCNAARGGVPTDVTVSGWEGVVGTCSKHLSMVLCKD